MILLPTSTPTSCSKPVNKESGIKNSESKELKNCSSIEELLIDKGEKNANALCSRVADIRCRHAGVIRSFVWANADFRHVWSARFAGLRAAGLPRRRIHLGARLLGLERRRW